MKQACVDLQNPRCYARESTGACTTREHWRIPMRGNTKISPAEIKIVIGVHHRSELWQMLVTI